MAEDNQKKADGSKEDQNKDDQSKDEIKKEKSLEDKLAESEDKLLRSLAEIENQRRRFEKESSCCNCCRFIAFCSCNGGRSFIYLGI